MFFFFLLVLGVVCLGPAVLVAGVWLTMATVDCRLQTALLLIHPLAECERPGKSHRDRSKTQKYSAVGQ